jgi:putative transcription factor
MCGREGHIQLYRIESAEVMACGSCGKYGTLISKPKSQKKGSFPYKTNFNRPQGNFSAGNRPQGRQSTFNRTRKNEILIEDFGAVITRARKKIGLSRKELAESLFIRETLLMRIETEKVRPNDNLVRKLEKTLEIKLMEASREDLINLSQYKAQNKSTRSRTMTLGDFATIKKSKK